MRRRRSATVALGLTAALATALSGCSSGPSATINDSYEMSSDDTTQAADLDDNQLVGVCVDPSTQVRLPDEQCDKCAGLTGEDRPEECRSSAYRHHGTGSWFYAPLGYALGRMGSRVNTSGLKTSVPPGQAFVNGGASPSGGTVQRPATGTPGRTGSSIVRGGFGSSAHGSSGG